MIRQPILGICAALLLIVLALCVAWFRSGSTGVRSREITMHRQWETNGYRGAGMEVPQALKDESVSAYAAGILGAYVQYKRSVLGLQWSKRYPPFESEHE